MEIVLIVWRGCTIGRAVDLLFISCGFESCLGSISQLPKLCVTISILMHRRMWVHAYLRRR